MIDFDVENWRTGPLTLIWPTPDNPTAFHTFACYAQWRDFVTGFGLRSCPPLIVSRKFDRAQNLYRLAWLDFDVIKAAELAVLVALELALQNQYGGDAMRLLSASKRLKLTQKPEGPGSLGLRVLLKHMIAHDGLTAEALPSLRRPGANLLERIVGTGKPNLVDIRNRLAHGDPFDGLHQAGLIELVRDLIDYAYRGHVPGPVFATSDPADLA
jgi:hypothetical protein